MRQAASPWRRWTVAVALTVAVAVILAIAGLIHRFKSPARNSIIEAAAAATPDAAALLLEANDVANRVVERFPESPRALAVMAQAHALFGGTDDAIQLWEQCIRLDPQDSEACFQVGSLAQGAGDQAKAAEYFQKAARLDPGSSIIPVEAARALMDLGKLEEAAAVLERREAASRRPFRWAPSTPTPITGWPPPAAGWATGRSRPNTPRNSRPSRPGTNRRTATC
jgi:tetratricopeptide (TPR) repeat protein